MAPAKKRQKLSNGSAAAVRAEDDTIEQGEHSNAQQSSNAESQQRKTLFVRSLPAETTSESLTQLFSESYPVKHAIAVTAPTTKECRGYGFVTFADSEDASRAREEFNGHALDGRKLRVEIAEPRHRESEGGKADQNGKGTPAQRSQEIPQPSRLIVRNLPWTIKTSDQLAKLFMSYGKVKQAYIPKTRRGLMAGFGFVVLRGRKNAEKALAGVNGRELDGRTLAVDWAVSKEVYEDLLQRGTEQTKDGGDGAAEDGAAAASEDGAVESRNDIEDGASDDEQNSSMIEDEDFEDEEEGLEDEEADEQGENLQQTEDRSSTLFVRNLPFTCTDEDLEDHFASFGKTRYARVVVDPDTDRSKGTGFVCFYRKQDADACLKSAPKRALASEAESKDRTTKASTNSILQNHDADPSGQFTLDGRVLQISRAVDRSEADRLTQEGAAHRRKRNEDKRRLYLLSEGTISSKSKLWEKLSPTERNMREASTKQRKALVESNPSLHLSLIRLSVRNIPRTITSKDLKSLAREAVVGFATDVKAGTRQRLSKEELARGGEDMETAEKSRKKAGKGVVKQAKVVFEGTGGGKVEESSGAGRSRGYGFIEYYTHRSALMGLRWLNGHSVGYQIRDEKKRSTSKEQLEDRKKRLIVEFAIENAQVVMRRKDREVKKRERGNTSGDVGDSTEQAVEAPSGDQSTHNTNLRKRKRGQQSGPLAKTEVPPKKRKIDEKMAQRNRIIGRKRAVRARRGAK